MGPDLAEAGSSATILLVLPNDRTGRIRQFVRHWRVRLPNGDRTHLCRGLIWIRYL